MRIVLNAVLILGAMIAATGCDARHQNDLTWSPDPHADFALMPRLSDVSSRINADLSKIDVQGDGNRIDCTSGGRENQSWSRSVNANMTGPRFLGLTVTDDYYCGGAHPDVEVRRITWDRQTDTAMDWNTLWRDAQVKPVRVSPEAPPETPVSMSPALAAWFRAKVRAASAGDPIWLADCDAHYGNDEVGDGLALWLDAQRGGIGMDLAWLAHAEQACGSPQVMPLDEAARLGAAAELTEAVRAAHRGGGWLIDKDRDQ
jgi:hypothetical protein